MSCDWLGLRVITFRACGLLTGCIAQFGLLVVSLYVAACAYAIALPHLTMVTSDNMLLLQSVYFLRQYHK